MNMLVDWLQRLPPEVAVILMAALPIAELRGAVPLGLALKLDPMRVFVLAFIGNLLPILPILWWLEPISASLRRFPLWRRFFDWLFARARQKGGDLIQRYEAIGLAIFVGIPLPMTGAWTGAIVALLFGLKRRYALAAIAAGVLLADLIVMALCLAGVQVYRWVV